MNILINMSHPLSAKAKMVFAEMVNGEFEEIVIPVQIDLTGNIQSELNRIALDLVNTTGHVINQYPERNWYYIPPALSFVAANCSYFIPSSTKMVIMTADTKSILCQFLPKETVYLN